MELPTGYKILDSLKDMNKDLIAGDICIDRETDCMYVWDGDRFEEVTTTTDDIFDYPSIPVDSICGDLSAYEIGAYLKDTSTEKRYVITEDGPMIVLPTPEG